MKKHTHTYPSRYLYTNVYSSFFCNSQKLKSTHMSSTDEQVNKLQCMHNMECYIALDKNKLLIHAITWMSSNNWWANEAQDKTVYTVIILFIWNFIKGKTTLVTQRRSVLFWGWGGRGLTAKGHKGAFWGNGNVLYQLHGSILQTIKGSCAQKIHTVLFYLYKVKYKTGKAKV